MKLVLQRPIAFMDLESTGKDTNKDRIIELAICKLNPDITRTEVSYRFNPQMAIHPDATAVHGITDADVANEPTFASRANEVLALIADCDLGGFNSNRFDFPMLMHEFARVQVAWDYTKHCMVDVGNIFKIEEPRTLGAAVQFYCGRGFENAHNAAADIAVTVDVFVGQLDRYPELPATVGELAQYSNYGRPILDLSGKFSHNDKGQIIFAFGVKAGEVALANMDYVDWMYYKASFAPDTRAICERLYRDRTAAAAKARQEAVDKGDKPTDDLPF